MTPGRSTAASTLLLALLACTALTQVVVAASSDRRTTAIFLKGPITTSRDIVGRRSTDSDGHSGSIPRRALIGTPEQRTAVWVLGVPQKQVKSVKRELQANAGALLHTVQDHWLVRAAEGAVQTLLERYPGVTAAEYPWEYKVSPVVETLMERMRDLIAKGNRYPAFRDLPKELRAYLHSKIGKDGSTGDAPVTAAIVALVPENTQQAVTDLATRLQVQLLIEMAGKLNGKEGCQINLSTGAHALKATVCLQHVEDVVKVLAAQPEITWVQADPWYKQQDLQATAAVQGSALIKSGYPAPDVELGIAAPYYPLWRAGLAGRNQVVGVIDSGLDMDSCYIWDPAYPNYANDSSQGTVFARVSVPPFNEIQVPVMFYTVDGHRKVQMYYFEQDTIDSKMGHGTHVITSIVGSPFNANPDLPLPKQDFAQGAAYDAKVALIDVGQTCQDGDNCGIYIDFLKLGSYLTTLKLAQGYVSVNSWGTETAPASTDNVCYSLNLFAYSEQNTLQVFPSGNIGDTSSVDSGLISRGSVNAPGICSNVLTVGATENWVPDGVEDAVLPMSQINVDFDLPQTSFLGPAQLGVTTFTTRDGETRTARLQPYNGYLSSMVSTANKTYPVVLANPLDACTKLANSRTDKTTFILVRRDRSSECDVDTSVQNVWDFGRSGGVIIQDSRGPTDLTTVVFNNFPTVYTGTDLANFLQSRLENGTSITLSWEPPASTERPPFQNVAKFSGFGSERAFSPDRTDKAARMKPDLCAPGYIFAGYSDGTYVAQVDQCNAVALAGTSMAAAQVGAAAMIVRQYFLEGYYPVGIPTTRAIHFPSGPLVKAVIIAGTAAMEGVSRYNGERLAPPPSPFQGFGRLDLTAALPIQAGGNGYKMQVIDRASFNATGMEATYMIDVGFLDDSKPLAVVLTWFDYPAFPGAPNLVVNDLDVTLRGPMEDRKPQTYFPNGLDGPDTVNNVEKIYLATPRKGTYRITVTASNISPIVALQQYSLVVLGAVSNTIYDDFNPAVNPQPNEIGSPPVGGTPPPFTTPNFPDFPGTPSAFAPFPPFVPLG